MKNILEILNNCGKLKCLSSYYIIILCFKLPDGLYGLLVGVLMGCSGWSSPSSKFDFMWYFFAGVLGDVELALDSFGDDAIEQVDEPSEKIESELHPPPGAFKILFNRKLQ